MVSTRNKKRKLEDTEPETQPEDELSDVPGSTPDRGDVWFEDGNMILVAADKVGFKVYRGILSQHSNVFREMLAQPASQMVDDCPAYTTSDNSDDLSWLLSLLHDSAHRYPIEESFTFLDISAMLRLGHKYQIEHIHAEALRRLKFCFPEHLDDFAVHLTDEYIPVDPYFPESYTSLKDTDCIAIINLARAQNLDILLPAAFFIATVDIPYSVLTSGWTDGDGTLWKLSNEDITRCLQGRDELDKAARRTFRWLLLPPAEGCQDQKKCRIASVKNSQVLWEDSSDLQIPSCTTVLHNSRLIERKLPAKYCQTCIKRNKTIYDTERQATWDNLRTYLDLGPAKGASEAGD